MMVLVVLRSNERSLTKVRLFPRLTVEDGP